MIHLMRDDPRPPKGDDRFTNCHLECAGWAPMLLAMAVVMR
jgi:hypothetical protein